MANIVKRKDDPYLYLWCGNRWYCYDPNSQPLGGGSMGTVYLGYDTTNGVPIAIKRVKDEYCNVKQIRERARLEASLGFEHPHLVRMIGCCEDYPDHGPMFILSQFVKGVQIDKFLAENNNLPDPIRTVSEMMKQVLSALDCIHRAGVIHRDIKPSNIMVEDGQNVRLMDLGIARLNEGNKFSAMGFIGTPQYSAPEQIMRGEGDNVKINASTDIYALGVTFYELLTGENPFDSPTQVETLTNQLKKSLPNSHKIPNRLMKVIWRATEKEQSKRYQSAISFRDAIDEALMPEPSFWKKIGDWMQQHNSLMFAALSVLVIIIVLLFIIIR